jgi:signal transduction histidine kinase
LLIVAVNATLIEGLFPIMVPGFILLIVVAGMLMGPKLSYTITIIAAFTWFIATYLLSSGTLIPSPLPENISQISVTIISVLAFIFVAILSQLATSDLRKALRDATYDLVQVNCQLEEASELKSQFTARTSHELRTPLSAIIALADLASRGTYGPLTEKMENSLELILQSARRLNALIDDILDLSRMEAGELKIVEERFDVHVLRDTVDSTLKENALKKGLGFKFTIPVDMPRYIVGDEKRISQILINLTDNAIKFTEDGSVKVGLRTHGDKEWVISVMDTGRGIPEDKFESIFDEFRQLDNITIDAEKRGTGLGLAITFELVQMMGGRMNLQSEIGQGSLFEVFLPLNVPQAIDQDARPVPVSIQ